MTETRFTRWFDERPVPVGAYRAALEVFRADGGYERQERRNLVVNGGMDYLASRVGSSVFTTNSAMNYMAIGTVSTAATLTNTTLTGEISRKVLSTNASSVSIGNVWTAVATWAGFADTVTSRQIVETGTFNAAGSGAGIMLQRLTFSSVVLADSDFLRVTIETTVGSR